MDSPQVHPGDGSPQIKPIVAFHEVSKWYGNVIGLNKLSVLVQPGITGLLGPNGAGKSTMLQLATGQLRVSKGQVQVLGAPAWNNPSLYHQVGLCPEQDAFYEWMSGQDFVATCARLAGFAPRIARAAADDVLEAVGMTLHKKRAIRGYSKGMRQRTKLAGAMVHQPRVLFLDEPMTGTDPVARHDLIEIIHRLAAAGRSVVVSSHVLYEVEALTSQIILLNRGRLLAQGHIRDIRNLMDQHPHRIVLASPQARALAAAMITWPDVQGINVHDASQTIVVETVQPDLFYSRLPELAAAGSELREVYSQDDNLEAVFKYLVGR